VRKVKLELGDVVKIKGTNLTGTVIEKISRKDFLVQVGDQLFNDDIFDKTELELIRKKRGTFE